MQKRHFIGRLALAAFFLPGPRGLRFIIDMAKYFQTNVAVVVLATRADPEIHLVRPARPSETSRMRQAHKCQTPGSSCPGERHEFSRVSRGRLSVNSMPDSKLPSLDGWNRSCRIWRSAESSVYRLRDSYRSNELLNLDHSLLPSDRGERYKASMSPTAFHLLLLGLVSLGNAFLLIAFLNRLLARPISFELGHRLKQGHDLLIVLFPLAILAWQGWSNAKLLSGGDWRQLPILLQAYGSVCLVMLIGTLIAMLWRTHQPPPSRQLQLRSRRYDLASELGTSAIGTGPYQVMCRLPGNQFLQLEITEKVLRLPRLPAAWDGLTILHLSDFHFIGTVQRVWYERVISLLADRQPDLIAFTGDLLDNLAYREWIRPVLGSLRAPLGCWYVLGNHDWVLPDVQSIRQELSGIGWRDATEQLSLLSHRGETLAIAGDERPWMASSANFAAAPESAFRLLLSHTPDLIDVARQQRVDLMLAGHNHGGQVRLPIFGPVYSPSRFGCKYAAGSFWEPPTFLHVNRGLGGRHPLRVNCPPEATWLILRSEQAD